MPENTHAYLEIGSHALCKWENEDAAYLMSLQQDGIDGGGVCIRQQHLILADLGHRICDQHVLCKSDLLLQRIRFQIQSGHASARTAQDGSLSNGPIGGKTYLRTLHLR